MSLLSAIARNLIRKEMRDRDLTKEKHFPTKDKEIEIVCKGDWDDTHAENFDVQIISDRLGLVVSGYHYKHAEVMRGGGMEQCFLDQNQSLLDNRRNVILTDEMKRYEDADKYILRTMYQADRNGRTYLYDFSMVCFKRKQQYIWLMVNGYPDNMWEHREKLNDFFRDLVCTTPDIAAPPVSNEKSLALRVAEAFGMEFRILPAESSSDALIKIWKNAARPGVIPLILVPDECFLDMVEELPDYPQPEEESWPEAETFLWQRLNVLKEGYESSEEDQAVWRETLEWDSGEEPPEGSALYAERSAVKEAGGFILLLVPAEKSWDVFRKIPFGGFNACPDNLEIMAVSRYWRQKFGAIPVMLGRDTLQYYLKQPPREEELPSLALEMFGFCEDIVFQGANSVRELGKTLKDSNLWFFWWD